MSTSTERLKIAVAVCTYKRNDDLAVLLRSLARCARVIRGRAAVGVAVVDDTAEGGARGVAEAAAQSFELGVNYRISGRQNISLARNLAIETAMEMGDLVVMTDDDCEAPEEWLAELLDARERTGADVVTGRMVRRVPSGSPRWLTEEPFLELGVEEPPEGASMDMAATFNSMISARWLRDHPHIRFDPEFGVIGGEDMVFYRAARKEGLEIRYCEKAFVFENEPPARANLKYQLYVHFWHGNSAVLAMMANGSPRWRMFIHSGASIARAAWRPIRRLAGRQNPQWRYFLAMSLHGLGKLVGVFDIRISHR